MIAASKAPLNYARWIRHGEVRAFDEYRRQHEHGHSPAFVILLLGDLSNPAAVKQSIDSIQRAFGPDIIIYSIGPITGGSQIVHQDSGVAGLLSTLEREHTGAWLIPLSAGDQLSPHLADILSRSLQPEKESLVYWDEDCREKAERIDPWIKPDWDPLLFSRLRGLYGSSAVPIALAAERARYSSDLGVDAASMEQLLLELAKVGVPSHIPLILTHRFLSSCERPLLPAVLPQPEQWPSVSIIIASRDRPELLDACLMGVNQTDYRGSVQLILIDNGTRDAQALQLLHKLEQDPRAMVIRDDGPFNFSRLNNRGASAAVGDLLCFLNNDVEPLEETWLTTLAAHAAQSGVGAVGAQLVYPSGRLQHVGVAVGIGGAAGHLQKGVDPVDGSFATWHAVTREVSAVTAAVMVLKREDFLEVGGFDQEAFAVAFNDVDLCLRLKQRGLRNIYVAEARLIHRESESRGDDRTRAHAKRFAGELARLQRRWKTENYRDPHFSPLFSRLVERCVLAP